MKGILKITILIIVVLLMAACSRKKNTFLSRSKHSVTAKFNALYNGNVAFESGKEELARGYKDNFWELLPVERLQLEEKIDIPGSVKNANFAIAEEKAAKAIQKHAIYIEGQEYNPQIDEAYILLGKARYFDGRFVQALDAFNFILKTYPTSNSINLAKIWKAKTNIRLDNDEIALENLLKMFKHNEVSKDEIANASATIAQAYINLDSLDKALPYIKTASEIVKDKELKGRYTYIKGQLFNKLNLKDSANLAFDEVIALNRKSPRIYMINAYIEKAKNFDFTKEDKVAFLDLLHDLEQDRENRPFLDKIYYQIGDYYQKNDSLELAIDYYNKSIQAYKNDKVLQSMNYNILAEIFFDDNQYKVAGAYYDSTLTNLTEGTKKYRRIFKKRENLDDVIKYEDIAIQNDSIITLINMNDAQRLVYFSEYTTALKQKATEDSIANLEQEQNNIANNEFFNPRGNNYNRNGNNRGDKGGLGAPNGGSFYFYNPTTVSFGKQEFKKRWGKRKLEDNWRISSKQSKLDNIEEKEEVASIPKSERYKPETYIALIPKEQKEIDSIISDRNFAYYQLGILYKEKFKEYDLAKDRLTTLLSFNPENRLVLPSLYNLYKINVIEKNDAIAEQYKNEIISRYPDSRYAEILQNPTTILAVDESSPEYKYKALYKDFEDSKYAHVIKTCNESIALYFGDPIVPKYELLKAFAIGRQDGFEAYKDAINFVALNYPSSKEGKEAQNLYETLIPQISDKSFLSDGESTKWNIVYPFNSSDFDAIKKLKEKLKKALKENNNDKMILSIDYYTPETVFVIIHGLQSRLGAKGYADILEESKKYKIKNSHFEISSPNYAVIQIHKNLDDYLVADLSKKAPKPKEEAKKEKMEKVKAADREREKQKAKNAQNKTRTNTKTNKRTNKPVKSSTKNTKKRK